MQKVIQKEAPFPHLTRRKTKLLSTLKVCFLILIGSGLFVGQANASQALIGMPFTGKWAYNALVSPPYTDSNSSHPSVHHTPGGGDWATDVYAAEGTAVKLDVTYPTSGVSFSWKTTSTSCGQSTGVNVIVDGTTVGWLYFAHLNSAVTSGTITNGMTLGTVHDWVVSGVHCNPGVHVHIESKNSSNYSCYVDEGQPGVTVNYGADFGILGSSNSGAQQVCASTSVNNHNPNGDYDGDGDTNFTIFRPSNSTWYHDFNGTLSSFQLGLSGDIPTPGNYDGDNDTDFAIFRPSNSTWYYDQNGTLHSFQLGLSGDIPVPGDYDGDGDTDFAIFRPSNSTWYYNHNGTLLSFQLGQSGDIPAVNTLIFPLLQYYGLM